MPSPFDALDAAMDAAILGAMGETVAVLRPHLVSQYAGKRPDPDRPPADVRGVFSAATASDQIKGQATSSEFAGPTRVVSTQPEFWMPGAVVTALPYAVRLGDLIEFPDRPGAPVYAVTALYRTDLSDLNLILVRDDAASLD